jgi:hypothetical protein
VRKRKGKNWYKEEKPGKSRGVEFGSDSGKSTLQM